MSSMMCGMLLGAGVSTSKTYVDDIFSTYVYTGTGSARSINNGINLSGEGGLLWVKNRDATESHGLFDSVRGATKRLVSNSTTSESTDANRCSAFNNNGFSLGTDGMVNASNDDYSSWAFRKSPRFFDVVTYTGNGSNRTISHSLGSIPGMIIIKRTDTASNWAVYNRGFNGGVNPEHYVAFLDSNAAASSHAASWNNSAPTSSVFHVGTHARVNGNGGTFVAYVFAGGESTAATARSVDFVTGEADALTTAHSSDFDFGSGDFTVEAWVKPTNTSQTDPGVVTVWNHPDGRRSWGIFGNTGGTGNNFDGTIRGTVSPDGQFATRTEISGKANLNQWNHVAFTRSSNTLYFFINGVLQGTASFTGSVYSNTSDGIMIGGMGDNAPDIRNAWDGSISNVRVVKGTAVYTSSFRPPTEPLTNITNTKLLCCNNSSTTGSTVTPGTITAHNSPAASTDSPFDDPAAFKFGDAGDQNVIKCGSYVGNDAADGPGINLGWEPQWVLIKRTSSTADWLMFDSMRGITTGDDSILYANGNYAEEDDVERLELTPTGFKLTSGSDTINNGDFIYLAIRRPDGYVGKPPELGTGVFAMATGNSSSTIPNFDSGFPVDFAAYRAPAGLTDWYNSSRLTAGQEIQFNATAAEGAWDKLVFDSNVGWENHSTHTSSYQSWMWKRYAGLDVVTYKGDGEAGRQVPHSLNKTVEMMWIKKRDGTSDWNVFNKGVNGGSSPENYYLKLNTDDSQTQHTTRWNDTAPTSTHFTLGTSSDVNGNGGEYIAMLFSSVDGISKCGFYDGSDSEQTITTGFQPRFVIIKRTSGAKDWVVLDTLRGWGSSSDNWLKLNTNTAQGSYNFGAPTSTGFTLTPESSYVSGSGNEFIYYAHA